MPAAFVPRRAGQPFCRPPGNPFNGQPFIRSARLLIAPRVSHMRADPSWGCPPIVRGTGMLLALVRIQSVMWLALGHDGERLVGLEFMKR